MSKIYSAEIHKNENASIIYGGLVINVIREIRTSVGALKDSKKADECAPGALHALRKLCEGEDRTFNASKAEVAEWNEVFFTWFNRVKRHIPEELREHFKENLTRDFEIISQHADDRPEWEWRKQSLERRLTLTLENESMLNAYGQAAEEKHPVKLGNALHEYLKNCLTALIDKAVDNKAEEAPDLSPAPAALVPAFSMAEDGMYRYSLSDFRFFDTPEKAAQEILVNAYDLEDALKKYLKDTGSKTLSGIKFDCESSEFLAFSEDVSKLAALNAILLMLGSDKTLQQKYLS